MEYVLALGLTALVLALLTPVLRAAMFFAMGRFAAGLAGLNEV